ncbi:Heat shock transcription factor [Quillaja saponaria]|uniref:Heat shock transcription factor n=1 Tax=Quillaja saponaria TaxID=32244 RepID=A0AAD7KRX9_QUISA|nr:Heat shock transcription factor [Quillaja saponaria]
MTERNSQGFRKVDPDRWEFANEEFLRGQKHLLRNITRRKPSHVHSHQQARQSHGQSSSVGPCVEVGKFGLEEEVERLKRDKSVLMQELVRLRQQQQATDSQMQTMVQRLQGMEQRQQQMMSFLAKAVQSPGFLAQFVQQQNESNRRIGKTCKKRRLKQEGIAESDHTASPDGQIVEYQPLMNEAAKPMLRQIMKSDCSSQLESFKGNPDNCMIGDASTAMDTASSSTRTSGVTLQEVPPTSGTSGHGVSAAVCDIQSSLGVAASEKITTAQFPDISVLVGSPEGSSIPLSQDDVIIPELSQIPNMMPESVVDYPEESYMGPETDNDGYIDPTSLGVDDLVPFYLDNMSPDPDIDALLDSSSTFWNDLFVQSPVPEEIESNPAEAPKGNEVQPLENRRVKAQNMDQLTEQMELLSSDTKGT